MPSDIVRGEGNPLTPVPGAMLAALPLTLDGSGPVDVASIVLPPGLVSYLGYARSSPDSEGRMSVTATCVPDARVRDNRNWGTNEALSTIFDSFVAMNADQGQALGGNTIRFAVWLDEEVEVTFSVNSVGMPGIPPTNEIQHIHFVSSSTAWTLTFDGQTTAPMGFGSLDVAVQAALETLSNINPGDVSVTYPGSGDHSVVEFTGQYAGVNVPQIVLGGPDVTGGDFAETITQGDPGTPTGSPTAILTKFVVAAVPFLTP